jgi:hypothetical protein
MAETVYELAPRQGSTASQRKAELDSARFVAVRNLAYMIYKKSDGQALMTYQETLDDREKVKQVIISHEIALGLLVNDIGAAAAAPAGIPQMAPQNGVPPGYAPQMGMPQQMVPVTAPPQYPVAPAVASPAAAAQAAQQPAQATQDAQPAAPTGRKRRSAQAAQGAQQMAPGAPPALQAPPQMMAPVPAPAAQGYSVPMTIAPPAVMQAPMQVSPPTGAVDLSPLLVRIDAVGTQGNELEKKIDGIVDEQEDLRTICLQMLAVMHHLYAMNQAGGQALQKAGVQTFDQFRQYMVQFVGNPK